MAPLHQLAAAWNLEPGITLGSLFLLGLYLGLARPLNRRTALFALGIALLLLSLVSPLHLLADRYLFSAHMLQHMVLVLAVPPLLLWGLPPRLAGRLLAAAARGGPMARAIGRPLPAWVLFNGALWAWHVPVLYEAALGNAVLHRLEHLIFLLTATLFWWPVVAPLAGLTRRPALAPWAVLLYLAAALVASTLLGIILTFAPPGLYPSYLHPDDPIGLLPFLRGSLGLSAGADQQLGGLLMWIPGGALYSIAIFATLGRWLAEPTTGPAAPSLAPDARRSLPRGRSHDR
jgi:cytochrome c oxidase assembly factor CtaG